MRFFVAVVVLAVYLAGSRGVAAEAIKIPQGMVAEHQRCVLGALVERLRNAREFDAGLLASATDQCQPQLEAATADIATKAGNSVASSIRLLVRRASMRGAALAALAFLDRLSTAGTPRLEAEYDRAVAAMGRNDNEMAFSILRDLARQDRGDAQFLLGALYLAGKGTQRDETQAVDWFRRAVRQGNVQAVQALAAAYDHGRGVGKDPKAAFDWYSIAAEAGLGSAQHALGTVYAIGKGVERDEAVAAQWNYRAAEQGFAEAQLDIAKMFQAGRGVAKDLVAAYAWAEIATEDSSSTQMRDAAKQFAESIAKTLNAADMEEGRKLAAEWRPKREAPALRDELLLACQAMSNLDKPAAESYLRKYPHGRFAALVGTRLPTPEPAAPRSAFDIRDVVAALQDETPSAADQQKLFELVRRFTATLADAPKSPRGVYAAAVRGPNTRYARGWSAQNAPGAKDLNNQDAAYWYALAAADGHAMAMTNLGLLVARGQGVEMADPLAAAVLWVAAAARGEKVAMFNLGAMFESGIGIDADLARARNWYQRAASLNHPDARAGLARVTAQ